MSAAQKLEWEPRTHPVAVDAGRTTIDSIRADHESLSIGRRYLRDIGFVLLAPVLWYFVLMFWLPLALVGLIRSVWRTRSERLGLPHLRRLEANRVERSDQKRFTFRMTDRILAGMLGVGTLVAGFYVTLGLYHLAAMAALATAVGGVMLGLDYSVRFARRFRPELRLLTMIEGMTMIERLPEPITVRAVRVDGGCAWGYQESDSWIISPGGGAMPAICRAAAEGLGPTLHEAYSNEHPVQFACNCPLMDRQVSFAWEPRTRKVGDGFRSPASREAISVAA